LCERAILAASAAWHLRNIRNNTTILNNLFDLVCRQVIHGNIYYNESDTHVNPICIKPINITPVVSSKYIYSENGNNSSKGTFFVDNFNLFNENINSNKRKIFRNKKKISKKDKLTEEDNDKQFKKSKSEESSNITIIEDQKINKNKDDTVTEILSPSKQTNEKRHYKKRNIKNTPQIKLPFLNDDKIYEESMIIKLEDIYINKPVTIHDKIPPFKGVY